MNKYITKIKSLKKDFPNYDIAVNPSNLNPDKKTVIITITTFDNKSESGPKGSILNKVQAYGEANSWGKSNRTRNY